MLLSEAADHCKKQHPQNPLKGDALLGVTKGKKHKQQNTLVSAVSLYN